MSVRLCYSNKRKLKLASRRLRRNWGRNKHLLWLLLSLVKKGQQKTSALLLMLFNWLFARGEEGGGGEINRADQLWNVFKNIKICKYCSLQSQWMSLSDDVTEFSGAWDIVKYKSTGNHYCTTVPFPHSKSNFM